MFHHPRHIASLMALVFCLMIGQASLGVEPYGPADAELTIIAMDPMAAPLACDCVQGYAQRKYESLADYLREKTGMTVRVVWSESIATALKSQTKSAQIIIGKDSVVRADAKESGLQLTPIAHLTDMNGSTKQKGLFVVLRDNPAATLLDLDGYQIMFGPEDCDEKDAAPRKKLKELDVDYTDAEVCSSCSTAAKKLNELSPKKMVAAVISSYAAPLLEGCGTVKKGDLKIVGESDTVPFISAFFDSSVSDETRESVLEALLSMHQSPAMLKDLETKKGFVPYTIRDEVVEKKNPEAPSR